MAFEMNPRIGKRRKIQNIRATKPPKIQSDRIRPQYAKNVLNIEPIINIGFSASNASNNTPLNNAIGKKNPPHPASAQKIESVRLANT